MLIDAGLIINSDSSVAFHFDQAPAGLDDLFSQEVHIRQVVTDAVARHYLGRIYITLDITCTYDTVCARCLRNLTRTVTQHSEQCFARVGTEVEDQDIIAYSGNEIDLSDTVADNIFAAVPVRDLCSEDCRGICPHCGIDLNRGTCHCQESQVDPRLAGLARLLEQD